VGSKQPARDQKSDVGEKSLAQRRKGRQGKEVGGWGDSEQWAASSRESSGWWRPPWPPPRKGDILLFGIIYQRSARGSQRSEVGNPAKRKGHTAKRVGCRPRPLYATSGRLRKCVNITGSAAGATRSLRSLLLDPTLVPQHFAGEMNLIR